MAEEKRIYNNNNEKRQRHNVVWRSRMETAWRIILQFSLAYGNNEKHGIAALSQSISIRRAGAAHQRQNI